MTAYSYGPLAAKAVALIAKYGATVAMSFVGDLETPADASKPWRGQVQTGGQTYSPKGLVSTFEKDQISGDLIRTTDQALLVAGQDPEVLRLIGDGRALDDLQWVTLSTGVRMPCKNLTPVQPGDTVMLYTLRLRLE